MINTVTEHAGGAASSAGNLPGVATEPNFAITPKISGDGSREGELLEISMGPHHPSTHGVFRMDVVLEGERIVKLKPVFGYLHRNHEKIAEGISYLGSMPYTDRLDYFCSLTNNWAYALSVGSWLACSRRNGRCPPRHHRRIDAPDQSHLPDWFSGAGHGALGTPLMRLP